MQEQESSFEERSAKVPEKIPNKPTNPKAEIFDTNRT